MEGKQLSTDNSQVEIIEERNTKIGNQIVRRYLKRRFLGKGGFAKCYQIENLQTKKLSAIKIISKQTLKKSKAKQKLVTEIKIHKSLDHKNIVMFDHVFEDSQNVYIVLQLCGSHTLNEMIKKRKRITEQELQYYLYHIIQGIIYIHLQKVIHRDLKLGNIMLTDNMEIKIGDFGLAAKLESQNERRKTICGTPNYLAPEIVNNLGHSFEVDIWSLGVVMYTLSSGRPPFQTTDVKKTYKRIKECQYTFNQQLNLSQNIKNLIGRILVVDPSKRLTLEQILQHPFMTTSKIPKQLSTSVLLQPPAKLVFDQNKSHQAQANKANFREEAKENEFQRTKSEKAINERLILRTATGFNRNLFYAKQNAREQNFQMRSNPQLLSNNFIKPQSAKPNHRLNLNPNQTIYVKKWVDYSSKYGLGYLLSDGTTGIYFNDSTKMIIDDSGQKIDYISNSVDQHQKLISFHVNNCPSEKEISKKLTLMQYFKKYLQNGGNQAYKDKKQGSSFIYIKKWVKSDQAILFRLNNKVIQVNFNDKSQIIFYTQKDLLLFSNSHGKEKQVMQINLTQLKKNQQIAQRLEIIKHLLRKVSTAQTQPEQLQRDNFLNMEIVNS